MRTRTTDRTDVTIATDAETPPDRQRRKEEFRTWFFLTFVMAPVLAVLIVSAFGFLVWFYQLLAGPPTYGG